jgi:hypothetical protein
MENPAGIEDAFVYLDINLPCLEAHSVAYYRLDPHFRDFLLKCLEKYSVAGFKWDGESLNFGVILGEKQ